MSQIIAESSPSSLLVTDAALVDTEKYFCPFLERGFCRDSSRCNFSHDCQTSIKIPTDYCHFYLANQCLFGQDCKFLHGEPDHGTTLLSANLDTSSNQNNGSNFEEASIHGDVHDIDLSNNNIENIYNYGSLEHQNEFHVDSDTVNESSNQDKVHRGYHVPYQNEQATEYSGGLNSDEGTHHHVHRQNNLSHMSNSSIETDQPSSSSSKLKALRLSHRCAMTPPSTSTTILARLRLSANTSQSSSKNSATSDNRTTPVASTASKSSWQGARLIASIRNNLGISNRTVTDSGSTTNSISDQNTDCNQGGNNEEPTLQDLPMCPYSQASGECPFPEGHCNYLHGLVCDLCYSACLHPYNEEQRHQHREECLREHEREMELSFAVQRSKDKVCGICMDLVIEKKPVTSSRFGILEKCNHIFCLDCIRKWRGSKQFESRTIRACPECRVSSDFVIPSKYWVEDQDDKDRLINNYKSALKAKPCRYFNEGKGECPFAGSCFYKHAYPDGRLAVMEAPKPRRRLYGARGSTSSVANFILWNILTSTDEDDLSDDEIQSLYDIDGYDVDDFRSDDESLWDRDYEY